MRLMVAFCIFVITGAALLAHGIHMSVKKSGNTITVAAFYSENQPVKGASVSVSTTDSKTICTGSTDKSGQFSFDLTASHQKLIITSDDGAGHRAVIQFDTNKKSSSNHKHNSNSIIYGSVVLLLLALSAYLLTSKRES